MESVAKALVGTVSARPAVFDGHFPVGVVLRQRHECGHRAGDVAVKRCAGWGKAVEDGELSLDLVTRECERRDPGVLDDRHERGFPRRRRHLVAHDRAFVDEFLLRELPGRIGVEELREHLDRDRAV